MIENLQTFKPLLNTHPAGYIRCIVLIFDSDFLTVINIATRLVRM